jgi:hypothetical protein
MNSRINDLTGSVFGRLTVQGFAHTKDRTVYWMCACSCGASKTIKGASLVAGRSQSCGCLGKERRSAANSKRKLVHGETVNGNSRTYRIWANMVSRCTNPAFDAYPYYGGRGIEVCERWRTFSNFLADMGRAPDGLSIDREDANGNYEPGNCRWATKSVQANNTRHNVTIEIDGRRLTVAQWSREPGASKIGTIYSRVANGWAGRRAVYGEFIEAWRAQQ